MSAKQQQYRVINGSMNSSSPLSTQNNIWLKHALHPETIPQPPAQPTYRQESQRIANELHHLEDILFEVHNVQTRSHTDPNAKSHLWAPQSPGMGQQILSLKSHKQKKST